ncbi:hypothetical protein OCE25_28955 [Bacillus cereus]|uniref:hypothetical protein n=1 Tax=Bacillus mycoides TaxID=1405 RepID=UPI001C033B4F|nr:hypothetical protein [Bacillus mycoides]MCU4716263.1 hypothetical protein [Bacillus cereus]QWH75459.1 hypothetical protein EXW59_00860 [Bacillus mycoides]
MSNIFSKIIGIQPARPICESAKKVIYCGESKSCDASYGKGTRATYEVYVDSYDPSIDCSTPRQQFCGCR